MAASYSEESHDLMGGSEWETRHWRGEDLRSEATHERAFQAWSSVQPLLTWYVALGLSLHV